MDGLRIPEAWDRAGLKRDHGVEPDRAIVDQGRAAARAFRVIAENVGIPAPSPRYAIVVHDLDRLGMEAGQTGPDPAATVSTQLAELPARQQALIETGHPHAVRVRGR